MNERNFFVVEKNRLIPLRQYEATLNRLSPLQHWLNKIRYNRDMRYAHKEIFRALKKDRVFCYLCYYNKDQERIKDVVARLKYLGYTIEEVCGNCDWEIKIRLKYTDENEEGIDYVSC